MNLESLVNTIVTWITTNGVKLIIGLVLMYIGLKLIKKVEKHFAKFLEKRKVDATLVRFLDSFTGYGLKALLFITILGYWKIELTGFAALIASGGVAIGLALQGSLSNFAGGFIILLLRPFKVGDYIETNSYQGTVEEIGLFYTKLVTVDNKLILIPNGGLSNGSLVNYSAKPKRRVDLTFGVGYECDLTNVKAVLIDIVSKHKLVIDNPAVPFVGVSAHSASSVDFVVRAWCKSEDYFTIYFDLLEEVKIRFDQEGISIPYPQMDVHLKKEDLI